MEAPKLRSPFRNIRTEPRRFQFRSPLYDPQQARIEERIKQLEDAERDEELGTFTRRRKFDFRARKAQQRQDARMRIFRLVIILIGLVIGLWKGLDWAEKTDFVKSLNILKND
jgi:hypothetical protein